ncbi:MAG: FHA domain-containing protein, partial [Acidobacteria bacterium]|nr:FHA domain-containing protein [Acidobacteriota bacterium]
MLAIELVFFDGTGRRFPVEEGCELLIGAAASAAVRLSGGDVSRNHALLSLHKGRLVLLDLGSTNGTFVNGRRIKEAVIQAGDAIRFSSVTAQVVPRDGRSSGSDLPIPLRPDPDGAGKKTSDRLPAVWWGGRLGDLISRWALGGESAVAVFAQWCVGVGGARGVAVIEGRDNEVAVLAADGEIAAALEAGAGRALAWSGPSGNGPESMFFEAADQQVL